jgi:hypothetical protein
MKYDSSLPDHISSCLTSLFFLGIFVLPGMVHADLNDLKVYSPIVEKGEFGFEVLGNTTIDGNDELGGFQYHEFEFEYGVTDWWASSVTNSLIKAPDGSLKYNVFGWENTFQFTEQGKYWLDFGVHIELEFDDENEESDQAEIRLMFRKEVENTEHILNLNFEQQFGSQAEESLELEYIWRTKVRVAEHTEVGFEAFGALGEVKNVEPLDEQEHIMGPAYYYEFEIGEVEVESHLVWLFGLTEASADNTFRWQLEFEF